MTITLTTVFPSVCSCTFVSARARDSSSEFGASGEARDLAVWCEACGAQRFLAQAFGRASVLSPEMYGTFFFLGDEDYPRLARLIRLHKQLEPLLKHSVPLPGGDIAHADGSSSLVLVRNMTWEPAVKTIPLDASIGLAAAPGAPLTVRQRHPWEMLMKRAGDGAVFGGTFEVEMDPFSLWLIQVDAAPRAEPLVAGVPYEIVPGPDAGHFGINLLGTPGQKAEVSLLDFGGRTVRTRAGQPVPTADKPWPIAFPGTPAAGPSFARLADFGDDPAVPGMDVYL